MDKIHVYILHYERPNFLFDAIKSVKESGIATSNITILDNGSSTKVLNLIKTNLDGDIKVRTSEENYSFSRNFLRCFDFDESEYFIALHDDDRLRKNFFQEQEKLLDLNADICLIGCNGVRIDELGRELRLPLLGNLWGREKTLKFYTAEQLGLFMMEGSCIPFSPILYRRKTVKKYVENILELEKVFGQGIDRAFLSFLVESGECIALNNAQLYDCRIHGDQDSKNISSRWDIAYIDHLLSRKKYILKERENLEIRIKEWYSINLLRDALIELRKKNLGGAIKRLKSIRYDLLSIAGILSAVKLGVKNCGHKKFNK